MRFRLTILTGGILLSAVIGTSGIQALAATSKVSANIKGTLSAPQAGSCAIGYAHQCASGSCVNFGAVGTPTLSGNLGNGSVTDFCITEDLGNNVNELAGANCKNSCCPVFGDLTTSVTKGGTVTETHINFAGAACSHQHNAPTSAIQAGFGIVGSSTDAAESGWGTVTGTVSKGTQAFSLKLQGSVLP